MSEQMAQAFKALGPLELKRIADGMRKWATDIDTALGLHTPEQKLRRIALDLDRRIAGYRIASYRREGDRGSNIDGTVANALEAFRNVHGLKLEDPT